MSIRIWGPKKKEIYNCTQNFTRKLYVPQHFVTWTSYTCYFIGKNMNSFKVCWDLFKPFENVLRTDIPNIRYNSSIIHYVYVYVYFNEKCLIKNVYKNRRK